MMKLDVVKDLGTLYRPPSDKVVEADVPDMMFVSIDGSGDPNESDAFKRAVEVLYKISYKVKIDLKTRRDSDHKVMPLEALWWSEAAVATDIPRPEGWRWRVMIAQPWTVTTDVVDRARDEVSHLLDPALVARAHYTTFAEGHCVQIMHIGPYSTELPRIEKMRDYIEGRRLTPRGYHHEIYLSDPDRVADDKLRTILRQPVD